LSLGLLAPLLIAVSPATATTGSVDEDRCRGVQAQIPVPVENIDPLVPDDFQLELNENLKASVLVGAVQCDFVTVGAKKGRKTRFVTLRVALVDPDPTDLPPPGYVPLGHAYTLWFASDNRNMVEYYRDQGGVPDHAAVHDAQLSITMPGDGESGELRVNAPSAPSPFTMTAMVEPLDVGALNAALDFWAKVPAGTMVQRPDLLDEFRLGGVRDGELKPAPGSEMDRIFCDDVERTSEGAVRFGGDDGSLRLFFRDGLFTVHVEEKQLAATSSATLCERPAR
jgi:hypothetical protein